MRRTLPILFLAVVLVSAACGGGSSVDGYFDDLASATCQFEEASNVQVEGCNLSGPFDTETEEMAAIVACYSGLREVIGVHVGELEGIAVPDEVAADHELAVTAGQDLLEDFDALIAELDAATSMTDMEERYADFVPPNEGSNERYQEAIGALEDYAAVNGIAADFACSGGDPILGARVQVSGAPLAPVGTDPDTALGAAGPTITGSDFGGAEVTTGGPADKPTAILFIAHWCGYCQDEVPAVQEWINANGMPEAMNLVSVITFNNDDRLNYPPDAWLSREGWTVPVIVDDKDSSAMTAYGGTAVPYWVILDADGNVFDRFTGTATIDEVLARLPNG